jgi:hypothetical protein
MKKKITFVIMTVFCFALLSPVTCLFAEEKGKWGDDLLGDKETKWGEDLFHEEKDKWGKDIESKDDEWGKDLWAEKEMRT